MQNILTQKIEKWATERGLDETDPAKQTLKLVEEVGELSEFITKDRNLATAKDAIGDIQVVLIILCLQLGLDYDECLKMAYEEIRHRKGKLVNGSFVKESDL